MIIPCPYCGGRIASEFSYLGDAGLAARPDYEASEDEWAAYVYLRDNPAGSHRELWRHNFGCGAWIIVERDTKTHIISRASLADDRS